ncbi:hypothetical protein D1AOALGA4SA_8996 [Olavius algarvensis Delta 1 endosymbiont]|nr:hypothetical protein D1AOALGA4SA_8996 [Olavius algarvensis Delta 1 endosymbiont]
MDKEIKIAQFTSSARVWIFFVCCLIILIFFSALPALGGPKDKPPKKRPRVKVVERLEALENAIADLQVAGRRAANRIWLGLPAMAQWDPETFFVSLQSHVFVLNPGLPVARVRVHHFDPDGVLTSTLGGEEFLARGGLKKWIVSDGDQLPLFGWILIVSDQPVLPSRMVLDLDEGFPVRAFPLRFYPSDCEPAYDDGFRDFEFVCVYIEHVSKQQASCETRWSGENEKFLLYPQPI